MKPFMNDDFFLGTPTAKTLFERYAKDLPIFDLHCHLSAKEIYENKQPENLYELWLTGDHYKWRAMRSAGFDEKYITGDAAAYEKFLAFAKTLTLAIGNPLFHWSHLELQRYFGITDVLNEQNAKAIWDRTTALLQTEDFRPQTLIRKSNVAALCTTDDPADSLEYHQKLKDSGFDIPVLPAFRPDKAIACENPGFLDWIKALSAASGVAIGSFADLKAALAQRLEFFLSMGCVASDQSVVSIEAVELTDDAVNAVLQKALHGTALTQREIAGYHYAVLRALGEMYAAHGLAMELHLGAMRNNNARMFASLGPDTGFDSIDDKEQAQGLSRYLDALDKKNALPKTILFTLNPKDNQVFGAMLGNFQSAEAKSKIQFGSAWWFNDNIDGMRAQLKALANLGVLGCFVGMVTDSRSFLSYPRHEYFRRILCNLIGDWVEQGLYPYDENALKTIIEGVCYTNARDYFLR